jgi:hypothetical protein
MPLTSFMLKRLFCFLVLCTSVFMMGCKKQAAIVPSYISVPDFSFTTSASEGTRSQYITDVWAYVDDEPIGAFQIPAKFPVLKDGVHVLKLKAGILLNARENERAAYPFYETYVDTITLVKGEITAVHPAFHYYAGTSMSLIEDFENSASIKFTRTSSADTILNLISGPEVFEGNYSAEIVLTEAKPLFEIKSFNAFSIPLNKPVFLEINCKTNYDFNVGIIPNKSGSPSSKVTVLTIQPNIGGDLIWKKIYVNLTPTLQFYNDATDFNIFIGSLRGLNTLVQPRILIDNVKLVGI